MTGGDSGIGKAIVLHFAREGANVAISYLDEHQDAEGTKQVVEEAGVKALLLPGDLRSEDQCKYDWMGCNACNTNTNAINVRTAASEHDHHQVSYKAQSCL